MNHNEDKKKQLKVEIYDLMKDQQRLQQSIQKIAQIINGKVAELEKLEGTPQDKGTVEEVKPN